jgi:preprotein translocase subunit SecB
VSPSSFTEDDARNVDVEVIVAGGGLRKDVYEGTLSVTVGGTVVHSVEYAIPIDEAG